MAYCRKIVNPDNLRAFRREYYSFLFHLGTSANKANARLNEGLCRNRKLSLPIVRGRILRPTRAKIRRFL